MKTLCIIPARYASSRLPGKPLAEIAGKPMIQWVYEQAKKADKIDQVIVATDHIEIFKAVENFKGLAIMTDPGLPSGTDRVYTAIKNLEADVVINLQGDEPFIPEKLLNDLVDVFNDPTVEIATAVKRIREESELNDPNAVKVIRDKNGYAIYFSRAVIPFMRDLQNGQNWLNFNIFYKHIGIYAYRKLCLEKLTRLDQSNLEKCERLEQLRFLENGFKIFTLVTDYDSISVDTKEDLDKVNVLVNRMRF